MMMIIIIIIINNNNIIMQSFSCNMSFWSIEPTLASLFSGLAN